MNAEHIASTKPPANWRERLWARQQAKVRADKKHIEYALSLLHAPDDVIEMRIKTAHDGTVSGWFDNHDALARKLASNNGDVTVSYTLNPVHPALMARAEKNKLPTWVREGLPRTRRSSAAGG